MFAVLLPPWFWDHLPRGSEAMKRSFWTRLSIHAGTLTVAMAGISGGAHAADPTVDQALKLAPIQKGVSYDIPDAKDVAKCTIKAEKGDNLTGWAVFGPANEPLRRFLDTNGDGQIDLWCYYNDGLEVYRDIDSDFNLKADQYRWFNTAGTRWGVDDKEDRSIDSWKLISAEEVSREIVAALAAGDAQRFTALLLTTNELDSLGLGAARRDEVAARLAKARDAFTALARSQKTITADTKWSHFGATQPGVVPSGTEGSTKDLIVYENVSAVVETGGKFEHLLVGTLIQVGSSWRLVDAPQMLSGRTGDVASSGIFFRPEMRQTPDQTLASTTIDEKVREIVVELQNIDKQLAEAAPAQQEKLNARRAALLNQLIERSKDDAERAQWTRQLADTVSLAVQSGTYADGLKELETLLAAVEKDSDKELAPYVKFRMLTAQYGQDLQTPDADISKVQATWAESLTAFAKDYPQAADTPDAILQLAIALESSGKEKEAADWYATLAKDHASSSAATKAKGAKTRLESVGKTMTLRGRTVDGKTLDIAALKGRIVVVHYWASYSEPCLDDLKPLAQLYTKYGRDGFVPVGVCLDHNPESVAAQLKKQPLNWPQIYEPGGLEGNRLANEMGIVTLPVMILVDKTGTVVNRNIHASELEAEIKKLLKSEAAAAKPTDAKKR
jgi:thiol-disulfide isomerase/thioredoxin